MKRLGRILAAGVLSAGLFAGAAAAETTCTIENTGEGSVNICWDENENQVKATCVNNIYVDNRNIQDAGTGDGSVILNTSGGGASSGQATNSNNTVVTIGASCEGGVKTVAPTQPQGGGGQGGGQEAVVTPAAAPAPAAPAAPAAPVAQAPSVQSLPETGSNPVAATTAIGTGVLAAAALAARFGLSVYRRLAIR